MLLRSDCEEWCAAEDAECAALEHKHKSWVVVDRADVPVGKKIYRCKSVAEGGDPVLPFPIFQLWQGVRGAAAPRPFPMF